MDNRCFHSFTYKFLKEYLPMCQTLFRSEVIDVSKTKTLHSWNLSSFFSPTVDVQIVHSQELGKTFVKLR